jgi:phosphoglycerol transferase MdoB-like AlkP superfamily enzyme
MSHFWKQFLLWLGLAIFVALLIFGLIYGWEAMMTLAIYLFFLGLVSALVSWKLIRFGSSGVRRTFRKR